MKTFKNVGVRDLIIIVLISSGISIVAQDVALLSTFNLTVNNIQQNIQNIQFLIRQQQYNTAQQLFMRLQDQFSIANTTKDKLIKKTERIIDYEIRQQELAKIARAIAKLDALSIEYGNLSSLFNKP